MEINIGQEIEHWQGFYEKYDLGVNINPDEIREIYRQNKTEMKDEIEKYGYDEVLIIPEGLPSLEELNRKLIETMEDDQGKVNNTWLSNDFKEGGGWSGAKRAGNEKTRIILTKNVQNVYESGDPIIEATLNKDIMELTGLTKEEVERRIEHNEEMRVNFEAEIGGKKIKIEAEGMDLGEYMILQRKYFDKEKKHLEESCWTRLLGRRSGMRVVCTVWDLHDRSLDVRAFEPVSSDGSLGCRLSRSFSF